MSHVNTSTTYLSREVWTSLQIKKIFASKAFDTQFEGTGVLHSKVTISKSTHLICIIFEIAWVEI